MRVVADFIGALFEMLFECCFCDMVEPYDKREE